MCVYFVRQSGTVVEPPITTMADPEGGTGWSDGFFLLRFVFEISETFVTISKMRVKRRRRAGDNF